MGEQVPRDLLRRSYDRSAPTYDERFRELQRPKHEAVLARVPPRGRVLDLGCGTGLLGVAHAFGLDLSFGMLERAPLARRVQGDAAALPFRNEAFETVYAVTVVAPLAAMLVEIRRVLVPGGVLALTLVEPPEEMPRELAAAGLQVRDAFACGQDRGWVAVRIADTPF